jgi:hypothetical protein
MFGAMTRLAERWRSIRFTEFERRQVEALRKNLNAEYETATHVKPAPHQNRTVTGISSTPQTWPLTTINDAAYVGQELTLSTFTSSWDADRERREHQAR